MTQSLTCQTQNESDINVLSCRLTNNFVACRRSAIESTKSGCKSDGLGVRAISLVTSPFLLRRSALFIAGSIARVSSSVGAACHTSVEATPTELGNFLT